MNKKQYYILLFGLLGTFLIILVPPWKNGSYNLIIDQPSQNASIDFTRLIAQIALLLIACLILYLFIIPTAEKIGKSVSAYLNKHPITHRHIWIGSALLLTIISSTYIWHFYQTYQNNIQAKEIIRRQQQVLAEGERQRTQAIVEENRLRLLATKSAYEQEKKRQLLLSAKLARLAQPHKWPLSKTYGNGVSAELITSWKENHLIYSFQLHGHPAALEYAVDAHPITSILLLNNDGFIVHNIKIEASSIKQSRDSHGAVRTMLSNKQTFWCDMKEYESITHAQLQL